MKEIVIANVCFEILKMDVDKILLQSKKQDSNQVHSIPKIGEHVQKNFQDKIENIVASEAELLVYYQHGNYEKVLDALSGIKSIDTAESMSPFELDVCFEMGLDWEHVQAHTSKLKEDIIKIILGYISPLVCHISIWSERRTPES